MGLLNQGGGAHPAPAQTTQVVAGSDKRTNAKLRREKKYQAACILRDALTAAKVALTADQQEAVALLCRVPKAGAGGAFGESIFSKIFGAQPTVGQAVTVQDIFKKTMKGVSQMNGLVRKWAAKGVATIEYVHNAQDPFTSQYIIKSLGTGNPATAEK